MDHRNILTPARLGAVFLPEFRFPKHIQAFQGHALRLLSDPGYNRAIIEVPVRHGKSFWWSKIFPAWHLITRPGKNVCIVAHTQDLASEFVSWIRTFLRRYAPILDRRLDPEQASTTHLRILGNGDPSELYGIGRGGAIAGRGVSLLVGDDLIRDQDDANSPTVRKSTNTWWQAEAMTRLEPGGKVVVCMSRRHPEDLSGYCLSQNGTLPPIDKWNSIKFRAIEDGRALWPERFPLDKLARIREEYANVGNEYLFDCLYQQDARGDPSSAEWPDSYFPPSIWYNELPRNLAVRARIVSCDLSKGAKSKAGDFSAILYMIWDNNGDLWVEDSWMRPCPLTEGVRQFASMIADRRPNAAIIETMGDQIIIDETNRLLDLAGVLAIPVYPYQSMDDKNKRIRSGLTGWLHRKRFHFRDTPTNRLAVSQFRSFPNGAHDDAEDSANMGVTLLDEHFA